MTVISYADVETHECQKFEPNLQHFLKLFSIYFLNFTKIFQNLIFIL